MRPAAAAVLLCALAASAAADAVDDGVAAARRLMDEGREDEATAALRAVREANPDDPRPLPLLAFLLVDREGRLDEAGSLLDEFLESSPGDAYAIDLLEIVAQRALDEGLPEVAREAARVLMRERPDRKEDLYLWAEASYRMGQRGSVRDATRTLIRSHPSYEAPYWLLAKSLEDDGRFEEAVAVYRDLLREQSGNVGARLTRASLLLWQLRDYDSAEGEFRSALEVAEPGSAWRDEVERGLAQVRAERDRSRRLRERAGFLDRLLLVTGGAWLALFLALNFALRRRA